MKRKEFSVRLTQFMNAVSPTQVDFAEKLGISPQALQKYMKTERLPMPALLEKLNKLGLNINWLLTGAGEMITEAKIFKPRSKPVPIIAQVDCGVPIYNQMMNEGIKYVDMFETSGLANPFIVIARGDSMVPYINNGDMLLCTNEPEKIKNGKAVIAIYRTVPDTYAANAKLVKFMEDESIMLYSVNTKYSPTTHLKTEIFKLYKVVRIIREVR